MRARGLFVTRRAVKYSPYKIITRALRPAFTKISPLKIDRSARSARAATGTTAAATAGATLGTRTCAEHRLRLHRQQAFTLQLLAGQLARAAHGFGLFAGLL